MQLNTGLRTTQKSAGMLPSDHRSRRRRNPSGIARAVSDDTDMGVPSTRSGAEGTRRSLSRVMLVHDTQRAWGRSMPYG